MLKMHDTWIDTKKAVDQKGLTKKAATLKGLKFHATQYTDSIRLFICF